MLQRLDRFRKGVFELAPTHVASQDVIDWPAVVDAWQILGKADPIECPAACLVSTWRPSTRRTFPSHLPPICPLRGRCSAGRHAGVGGKAPPLHVCPGPESGGSQRMYFRPQGAGHLGVDPLVTVGQVMEIFKGGNGFPGTTTVWGTGRSSSVWPSRASGWGSGKCTQRRSCPLPRYAGWGKYRRFDDQTSPRW